MLWPHRLNVFVPWNEVVVLDPVKLSRTTETGVLIPDLMTPRKPCKDHDFDYMKPLVLATWKHGFQVNFYPNEVELRCVHTFKLRGVKCTWLGPFDHLRNNNFTLRNVRCCERYFKLDWRVFDIVLKIRKERKRGRDWPIFLKK